MKRVNLGAFLGAAFALTPAAFAIREDDSPVLAARESANIPAPGERLVRTNSAPSARESVAFSGAQVRVDGIDQSVRLVSGRLGLSLITSFGGDAAYAKWQKAASRSDKSRTAFRAQVEKAARHFIATHQSDLKFASADLRLNETKFSVDSEHVFLSFDVVLNGVLVKGTSVDFRFSEGELIQIAARTFGASTSQAARMAASTARSAAPSDAAIAARVLGPTAKVAGPSAPLVYVTVSQDGRSYEFKAARQLEAVSATGEGFAIVSSASSSDILEWNSLHLKIASAISGVVVNRAPGDGVSTHGLPYAQASTGGGWGGWGKKVYTSDDKGRLNAPAAKDVTYSISSPYFKVKNSGGQSAALKSDDATVLFDAETNSTLAETSAFYHLNVVRQWAKSYISSKWFDSAVPANVNIKDQCNAFWNGTSVNFFAKGTAKKDGKTLECRNTGEIADVMYHEWGHGLDHNIGGIGDRAYSEGIGDVVSMLITRSPLVGPGFFADGTPVRDMEGEYKYPADKGPVHKEGLIIGSTWYHLTKALASKYGNDVGYATASRYFLKSLFTTSQYTDAYDAIVAIDSDNGEARNGPNFCLINAAFARHGLADKDRSCLM